MSYLKILTAMVLLASFSTACKPAQKAKTDTEYFTEGWTLTQQERHAEAEPLYRKALDINPANVTALNNLGWAIAKQGRLAESVPLFEKALSLDPNFQLAQNNLNWVRTTLNPPPPQPAPAMQPVPANKKK